MNFQSDHSGAAPRSVEIAWQARRIPLSYGRHVTGQIPISFPRCAIRFESQLERDVIVFLSVQPGIRFIQSQPFTLRYVESGRRLRYTPDLLVVLQPIPALLKQLGFGAWTVVEVKPQARLCAESVAIRSRLEHVCQATGFATVCLTEQEIARGGRLS